MSSLYIRVMTGFYNHRKTVRLRARIGVDAFWLPPRLWAYCAENQPDGDVSSYSAEDVAALLGYTGDATSMLQALKDVGFVDIDGRIHDWSEHNGYHERYSARAKIAAQARWGKKKEKKQKKEVQGKRKVDSGDKHCLSNACSIDEIYQAYPRKVAKPAALKAISKALNSIEADKLLALTQSYAKTQAGADIQFIPHPSTWFNQERYNDFPETWVNSGSKKQTAVANHEEGF